MHPLDTRRPVPRRRAPPPRQAQPAAPDEAELVACEQTIYGGLQISETKRRKALEEENRRLKRIVAD
jgi:hypothetical protein